VHYISSKLQNISFSLSTANLSLGDTQSEQQSSYGLFVLRIFVVSFSFSRLMAAEYHMSAFHLINFSFDEKSAVCLNTFDIMGLISESRDLFNRETYFQFMSVSMESPYVREKLCLSVYFCDFQYCLSETPYIKFNAVNLDLFLTDYF
jgi:hypothetical protein